MTDYIVTTQTTQPMLLGGADNAFVSHLGAIAASNQHAVRMASSSSGTPALTVLGTVWSGGSYAAVSSSGSASVAVGPGGWIGSARGDAIQALGPVDGPMPLLTVMNSGTIEGRGAGLDTNLVNLHVSNAGTIRGAFEEGIDASGAWHRIANTGIIEGVTGIRAYASAKTTIVNDGHIAGHDVAVSVSGAQARIVNRGTLDGEVLLYTVTGEFDGRGGSAAEVYGGSGDYVMIGGAGEDSFYGGSGADELRAGAGDDLLSGNGGSDLILGGDGDDRLFGGTGEDSLRSGAGDDQISGDDGADTLEGGAGDDDLYGGTGDDMLFADAGNDTIDGGEGRDTLVFRGAAAVRVNLALTEAQDTGRGQDILRGVENVAGAGGGDSLLGNGLSNRLEGLGGNDNLAGLGGADLLLGGAGADTLDGGTGNDTLRGGTGDDRLTGGADADIFVFRTGEGRDTITDFQNGIDRIDLRGLAAGLAEVTVTQSGTNTVLTAGDVQITLNGVAVGQIDATDFLF